MSNQNMGSALAGPSVPGLSSFPSGKGTERQNLIRRYVILGERRTSNYLWAFVVFLGSCGFLLTGLSSYYQFNLISSSPEGGIFSLLPTVKELSFFPQGLLMCFYGSLGFLLSLYWGFNIFWNVGGGFNEFNKKEAKIRIFRWGYPGKNRRIDLSYFLKDVEAIKVELKQGLDPQRTIYLKLKGKREIPLTGIGEPLTLKEIEKQASELANFLQVSVEGL
nr:photosystem I assembly protein ycf4 [Chlorococcum sp. KSF0227]